MRFSCSELRLDDHEALSPTPMFFFRMFYFLSDVSDRSANSEVDFRGYRGHALLCVMYGISFMYITSILPFGWVVLHMLVQLTNSDLSHEEMN